MRAKTEKITCDFCGKELKKNFITTTDVPNEGCSVIEFGKKSYTVGNSDYCDLQCLMADIAKELGLMAIPVDLPEEH